MGLRIHVSCEAAPEPRNSPVLEAYVYNARHWGGDMKARLLTVFAVIIGICCVAASGSRDKTTGLVQRNFDAWNAHDPDKVVSLYTDDVVYEDVAFGLRAHGHAELRKMVADFFTAIPDLKLEIVSNASTGDRGSVEWVFSGTDVGLYKSGKKFSVRGASIYELRGGKFSGNRDYYDSAAIMRQVGTLPPAGPSSGSGSAPAPSQKRKVSMSQPGRILGIGGIFFKSANQPQMKEWYATHLGLADSGHGVMLPWREKDNPDSEYVTVWSIFPAATKYFDPSPAPFMMNYIVDDMEALLDRLGKEGVRIDPKRQDESYGRFAWIYDPDGNKIELWQPHK
jgi:steroid delta-isomerase-like uncharacterized protein